MIQDGALKEEFQVELLGRYPLEECLEKERSLAKTTLYPKGLNGNAGDAIVRTEEGDEKVRVAVIKSVDLRLLSGTHNFCDTDFQKEMSQRGLEKQRANGNINKWNKKGQDATKELVKSGMHVFQDKVKQKERAIERTRRGNNPFSGERGSLIAHQSNQKMLLEGRHPSQIRVSCLVCKRDYSIANFVRYHNGKCEVNHADLCSGGA